MPLDSEIQTIVELFQQELVPLEKGDELRILTDYRTGARFCECHIHADKLVTFATTDAPIDPADQSGYKANREILETP